MTLKQKINIWDAWSWIIIVITMATAFYFYEFLPEQVITHWDISGQPNGWSSKEFASFFFPALLLVMYLLFQWFPRLDPRKGNYKKFTNAYRFFIFAIILFMALIYFITNLVNLGVDLDVGKSVMSLVGLLLIIIGSILDKVKSNWFIGIRTPWTLSSETVWKQTHIFAKKVFTVGGLVLLVSQFLPENLQWPAFIIVILFLITPAIYSYFLYKKE